MVFTIIISLLTCILMILSVLFFPKIHIGKLNIDSYWVIVLMGAFILLVFRQVPLKTVLDSLFENSAINPIKILVLFISMTILSVFLDELGFFSYLANVTLKKAKDSQLKLFVILYVTVSILTVFTSNDIIILSFTPFICYFCERGKINPLPYLACEFIAANTFSMTLIIGNPTNIYLATAFAINFIDYFKIMILPTVAAGLTAFLMLFILYHKNLKQKIEGTCEDVTIEDKTSLIIGLIHLAVCTIFLIISSYINVEMWIVSFASVISLSICNFIVSIVRHKAPKDLGHSLKRAPWQLIPFVLSMFIIILTLKEKGVTDSLTNVLGTEYSVFTVYKYGYSSFLFANLINNIPMAVLYSAIISPLEGRCALNALFASIVGSNLGAYFTPIGALAGIMWSSIIAKHNVKFTYLNFIKMGVIVSVPTITICLFVLSLII